MIIIRTDAQTNRKALAGALSELLHEKPRYCGAPTFAYEFGVGLLARDASLRLAPSLNERRRSGWRRRWPSGDSPAPSKRYAPK